MGPLKPLLWIPILLWIMGGEASHAGNPQTISWSLPAGATYTNQPIAFRAIASSGLPVTVQIINGPGSLLFEPVNRPPYGTNWTGQLVMTGAGTITLRAEQAGNDDHLPVVSERTVVVSKASQRLTVTPLDATFAALIDTPYPAGFFATASSGLTPVLAVTSGPAMVVSNSMIVTNVGLVTISLSQPGNADFTPATPVTRQFNRSEIEITQVGAAPHPKAGMGPSFFGSTLHQGFAFLAQGTNGIAVVDFNEAGKPRYVTNAPAGGRALQLAIHRNVALVACGTDGVSVLDVSNPRLPNLVSGLKSIGNITEVESAGAFVVARDTGTGLVILDVSTPLVPRVRGRYAVPGGIGVLTAQSNIVVVTTTNRLILVDIGNPESPVVANTVLLPEAPTVAKLHGGYAYVGGPTLGLLTVGLGNLHAPLILQTNAIEGSVASIAARGSTIVTLSGSRRLQVFGLGPDGLPGLISTELAPFSGWEPYSRIHLSNGLLVGSGRGSMVAGILAPASLIQWQSAYRNTGAGLVDVERKGGLAIASDGASAFLFDVSDRGLPRWVSEIEEGSIGAMALALGYAYMLSDMNGFLTFDVSTPSAPVVTARHPLGSFRGMRLKLNGTHAWLLGWDSDGAVAHLFDLANPAVPRPISTYRSSEGSGWYSDVAFGPGWVVLGGWLQDFEIVDTSVPEDLRLIRRSPVRSARSLCLAGEVLLGSRGVNIDIYQIAANLEVAWKRPYLLSTSVGRIEYYGGRVIHNQLGRPNGVIQVATINTVTNRLNTQGPFDMKDFTTAGTAQDIAADGQSILVADGNAGLVVLEYREGVKPVIRSSLPPRVSGTNGPIDLASAVRGTAPLTYSVVSGPAMISEGRLHLTGAGRVVVQAESPETQQFFSVTNRWSIDVAAVQQSITWTTPGFDSVVCCPGPVPVAVSASSGLPVSLRVESGPASLVDGALAILSAGQVILVAEQGGDERFLPVMEERVITVLPAPIPPRFGGVAVTGGGGLRLNLEGPRGAVAILEFSPDLRGWIPISTNSLPRQLELPLPAGSPAGFYRTVVR